MNWLIKSHTANTEKIGQDLHCWLYLSGTFGILEIFFSVLLILMSLYSVM